MFRLNKAIIVQVFIIFAAVYELECEQVVHYVTTVGKLRTGLSVEEVVAKPDYAAWAIYENRINETG